jgi:TetR/AcrR family transcriptional regulator, transcriptional repressor of bet genes
MPKVGMEPIRREQIRKAAAKVIAKNGFEKATLMGVAKAARVSTGTINHYYKNKLAVLFDALLYSSEWFQARTREAVAKASSGPEKLKALTLVGIFDDSKDVATGLAVWIWALSESINSKALRELIADRRRLYQQTIADIIQELDESRYLGPRDIAELATELDAYINGLGYHRLTGEKGLDAEAVQRSLLALVTARIGQEMPEGRNYGKRHPVRVVATHRT